MTSREAARLSALRQLDLLDTPPSESFDRITRMASQLFGLPIAAVSLTDEDRQWFKSRVGVDHWQIPREKAPCAQVGETNDVLVLPDLSSDPCYRDSLLAQSGVRFYAGAPLVTRDGYGLGAMCVLGAEPRDVTEHEVTALKDLAAMVMAQIELQHAFGRIDPQSGLPNRHQMVEDLEDMARDKPGRQRHAVLLELADAQEINAVRRAIGAPILDMAVKATGQVLRDILPPRTKIYQVGATSFACLLGDIEQGVIVSEAGRICGEIERRLACLEPPLALKHAVGVAPFRLGETGPEDVLRRAHGAAQDARDADEDIGVHSPSRDHAHKRRFGLLADLPEALARAGELWLAFQPRIDMKSGECVGAEALIRWTHPRLGPVSPAEFIPLAEKTALARPLTDWVVATALRQALDWRAQGVELKVSLNVSAANLEEADFSDRISEALKRAGLPAEAIEIELTESAFIRNGRLAQEHLNALSQAGLTIAIDDFGTGYSSLSYLQQIPATVLKIDRSFVRTLAAEPRTQTLVGAMIGMARDLGYRVVAEGVETAEDHRMLAALGCDEAQGYFHARPMPAAEFSAWLEARMAQPRRAADGASPDAAAA